VAVARDTPRAAAAAKGGKAKRPTKKARRDEVSSDEDEDEDGEVEEEDADAAADDDTARERVVRFVDELARGGKRGRPVRRRTEQAEATKEGEFSLRPAASDTASAGRLLPPKQPEPTTPAAGLTCQLWMAGTSGCCRQAFARRWQQ